MYLMLDLHWLCAGYNFIHRRANYSKPTNTRADLTPQFTGDNLVLIFATKPYPHPFWLWQPYNKNLFATRNISKDKALAKISRTQIKFGLQNVIEHWYWRVYFYVN